MKKFLTVTIGTFSLYKDGKRTPLNGMVEPLLSFFNPRKKQITLIDGPFPGSDNLITQTEMYKDGTLVSHSQVSFTIPPLFILNRFNSIKTQPTFKIRDFISTFLVILSQKEKTDLFIGLESIYTLAGILLKKLGKIHTVVYYVSDYSPTRYSSKLMNNMYHWLDRLCCTHADYIWDVSKAMMPARISIGLDKKKAAPLIHVPNALFPSQIRHLPIEKLTPYSVVFAGSIGPENGLDLAIEAVALARKKIPQITLHIFGGGLKEDEERAKKLVETLKLGKTVINHGFITNLDELSNMLTHFMVGLAPYRSFPWSVRWYADATKMRLYFANGLPVITTYVPPLGKEAKQKGCAIIVTDTKGALADAIVTMFSNKKLYNEYRKAAIVFAQKNTWENTYKKALTEMDYEV